MSRARQLVLFADPHPRPMLPPGVQAAVVHALADLFLEILMRPEEQPKEKHESEDQT